MKIGLILILVLVLGFLETLISAGVDSDGAITSFDMQGTITDVLTPSSVLVGDKTINLAGVDSSGLNAAYYAYLMQDLKDYYIGKDVFVKGNYIYFDLGGEYNVDSINGKIQKEIDDLAEAQYYDTCYYYGYRR
ncbi:MAG: hypothetical protein ACE14P_02895 [Methanotrichaceae archaeon]